MWEVILTDAVKAFLGFGDSESVERRFAGVETTGLSATELHDTPAAEVRKRMKDAVKRLLSAGKEDGEGRVGAICLGCAGMIFDDMHIGFPVADNLVGMAGMDEMVREACVEELGEEVGKRIRIVDGVVSGVAWLEGAIRSGI